MKKRYWFYLLIIAVILWGFYENTLVQINSFPVNAPGLPDCFDGLQIAHISDLHNTEFGKDNQKLLALRFGLEGGKPLSPEEAGRRLGLTPDEVVAREGAALAMLRNK